MTDAMEVLFHYAQEHTIPALLAVDKTYLSGERCAEAQETALRSTLDQGGTTNLDAMLGEMDLVRTTELRAVFRAGFRLAMELGRF